MYQKISRYYLWCMKLPPHTRFKLRIPVILILLFTATGLRAQTKIEREFRIRETEVPAAAKDFVASCGFGGKVKWYREENGSTISYEAKTRHKGKKYSIEFSEGGVLEDAEVLTRMKSLAPEPAASIKSILTGEFNQYRVEKVQLQYSGSETAVREAVKTGKTSGCTVKYELVVAGSSASENGHFEMLFDAAGILLERVKIAERGTENIEY